MKITIEKVKVNKAKCRKCDSIIQSKYRRDFRTCKCGAVSVDGGLDYIRRCGNIEDIEELSEVEHHENEFDSD